MEACWKRRRCSRASVALTSASSSSPPCTCTLATVTSSDPFSGRISRDRLPWSSPACRSSKATHAWAAIACAKLVSHDSGYFRKNPSASSRLRPGSCTAFSATNASRSSASSILSIRAGLAGSPAYRTTSRSCPRTGSAALMRIDAVAASRANPYRCGERRFVAGLMNRPVTSCAAPSARLLPLGSRPIAPPVPAPSPACQCYGLWSRQCRR